MRSEVPVSLPRSGADRLAAPLPTPASRPPSGALRRVLIVGAPIIAAVVLWVVGLFLFAQIIRDDNPGSITELPSKDAIVVLTGGRERLPAAFVMLSEGKGQALLVSGVHGDVGLGDLMDRGPLPPELAGCCVDLGHAARDTVGNASEAAAWAETHGFASIWLVTSNYHMPRSVVEFRQTMPKLDITPYPVASPEVHLDGWWRWPGTTRLVVAEYNKFLYASLRSYLRWIGSSIGLAVSA